MGEGDGVTNLRKIHDGIATLIDTESLLVECESMVFAQSRIPKLLQKWKSSKMMLHHHRQVLKLAVAKILSREILYAEKNVTQSKECAPTKSVANEAKAVHISRVSRKQKLHLPFNTATFCMF